MLSWRLIRNTCLALLALPLVHFTWVVAAEHIKRQAPDPEVWQEEVDTYTREAQSRSLPEHPVVITGGRQARLWTGLESLLAPRPVLMRGLGDATVDDLIHYYQDLIGYYRPETLVLLVDHNEFQHRDNKQPEELLEALQTFTETDRNWGATRHIYLIGPIKAPYYPEDHARIAQARVLLADWATGEDRVTYLNPGPVLETARGEPDSRYFRPGGQHLDRQGYLRLGILLRAALEAEEQDSMSAGNSANSP